MYCPVPGYVAPTLSSPLASQNYSLDAAVSVTLPVATGGFDSHPDLVYSLYGQREEETYYIRYPDSGSSLLARLTYSRNATTDVHTISGRPTATGSVKLRYDVQDAATLRTTELPFALMVVGGPAFDPTMQVDDQTYAAGSDISTAPLAAAIHGGGGTVIYALAGPNGVALGTAGTTYSATNTVTIPVTVTAQSAAAFASGTANPATLVYRVGTQLASATSLTSLESNDDTTKLVDSTGRPLDEAVPGLTYTPATTTTSDQISGTLTVTEMTLLTYSGVDANGNPSPTPLTVTIIVRRPELSAAPADMIYTVGAVITTALSAATILTTETGMPVAFAAGVTYTLTSPDDEALGTAVPGLAFALAPHMLTSTPPTTSGAYVLTYTATETKKTDDIEDWIKDFNSNVEIFSKDKKEGRKNTPGMRSYLDKIIKAIDLRIDDVKKDLTGFKSSEDSPKLTPIDSYLKDLLVFKHHVRQVKDKNFENWTDDSSILDIAGLLKGKIIEKINDWWIYKALAVIFAGMSGAIVATTIGFYRTKALNFLHSLLGKK